MKSVRIGNFEIGPSSPAFIIGEIGINHNGDIGLARKMIDAASEAGCNSVKFQKRTVKVVYSSDELSRPRKSPFGLRNGDLKFALEFGDKEYSEINSYCQKKGMLWFSSCWDEQSVDFLSKFNPPCYKISSASLTDDNLLRHCRGKNKPIIMSTGMSTLKQVDHAVEILGKRDLILMHTNSSYPSRLEELNLGVIQTLRNRYNVPVGYSGHELGIIASIASVAIGACAVERHITMNRDLWGSDQFVSIPPEELQSLINYIRIVEQVRGDGVKKLYDSEIPVMQKLRRV